MKKERKNKDQENVLLILEINHENNTSPSLAMYIKKVYMYNNEKVEFVATSRFSREHPLDCLKRKRAA